ncbi:hypothetical protein Dda_7884 [Drechslerella dactyloides]|uniref:PA2779 family protein n=1 Tax=Drechslerella dactyloides TaxID=74499 RepID=A0AAD6IRC6_DREDA|nr:hypothetical protein Dda_7884 [Drechslerella dactyloides]
MYSSKHLSILLLAGLFGLQALAGPIPGANNNQIAASHHDSHKEDALTMRQLANTVGKLSIARVARLRITKRDAGNELAERSLAARAADPDRMIVLSPEELSQLHDLIYAHQQQFFTTSGLQSPVAKAVLLFILIGGIISGCILLLLPAGLLI